MSGSSGQELSSSHASLLQLGTLPNEVWSSLASLLHVADVLSLWKCGNTALNRKIAAETHTVRLEDDVWHSTSRFPKIVLQLHNLRHFSISKAHLGSVMAPHELADAIQQLPPSLESLALDIKDGLDSLISRGQSSSISALNPDEAPITIFFINLGKLFPRLSSLSANRGQLIPETIPAFHMLPSTLTTLLLPEFKAIDLLPYLPACLTRLSAYRMDSLNDIDQAHLASRLPPRITHLSHFAMEPSHSLLSALPKSVTQLDAKPSACLCSSWDPTWAAVAPPLLIYLRISFPINPSLFKPQHGYWSLALPRHLTWLELTAPIELTPSIVADLPRTLIKLTGAPRLAIERFEEHYSSSGGELHRNDPSYDIWPPQLTSVAIQSPILPELGLALPQLLSLVPPTIRDLKVSPTICNNNGLHLATFPTREGPHTLTKLHATANDCFSSFAQLPPTLIDLAITPPNVDRLEDWKLPEGLTRLQLGLWDWNWFGEIPRSVTELSFGALYGDDTAPVSPEDMFKNLPPKLRTLEIKSLSFEIFPQLSSKSFSSLQHLTTLACISIGTFDPKVLQSLSRHLKILEIWLKSLTEDDLAHVPPRLKHVNLGPAHPTSDSIIYNILLSQSLAPGFMGPNLKTNIDSALSRAATYPDPRVLHCKIQD